MPGSTSKPPREWVESDIAGLIRDGVKESIDLDYKACDSLRKTDGKKAEISKDVSAFANSAGGTIVYGVLENGHVPTGIDIGFDPDDRTGTSKEWLESVINGNIKPRLSGVVINQVELSTVNPGRVLYVVDIPQTIAGGPHQASDHRYYKRFNFQSVAMEDYEIRDVMRRALGPDLYCEMRVNRGGKGFDQSAHQMLLLSISVGNRSPEPALYATFDLFVETALTSRTTDFNPRRQNVVCRIGDFQPLMNQFRMAWVTPNSPPFWEGIDWPILRSPMQLTCSHDTESAFLVMALSAPHMTTRTLIFQLDLEWETTTVVRRDDLTFNRMLSVGQIQGGSS